MISTLSPTKLMTAEELWRIPSDDFRYELVKGELRQMAPAGGEHGATIVNLTAPLKIFVDEHNLGVVFAAETGFKLAESPDVVRAPDIAFVARARIAEHGIPQGFLNFAPDLAVEVVSPHDRLYEVDEKVDDFLFAGTRVVCVVYPKRRTITIHRPDREPQILTINDTLDLGEIVPGFRLPVSKVFV